MGFTVIHVSFALEVVCHLLARIICLLLQDFSPYFEWNLNAFGPNIFLVLLPYRPSLISIHLRGFWSFGKFDISIHPWIVRDGGTPLHLLTKVQVWLFCIHLVICDIELIWCLILGFVLVERVVPSSCDLFMIEAFAYYDNLQTFQIWCCSILATFIIESSLQSRMLPLAGHSH